MKATIDIPDELYCKLEAKSASEGRPLQDVAIELFGEWVGESPRRQPDEPRAFRAWGYPWAPALFVLVSGVMLVNDVWRNPVTSAAGLAIISLGIPVYYLLRRRA